MKKKLLIKMSILLIVLVILLDCFNIIFFQKPLFSIHDKNTYKGILFTTHICNGEKVSLFRWKKYECEKNSQDNQNNEPEPSFREPIGSNFDFSINNDLTNHNIKKYIFDYDNIKYYYIDGFTIDIVFNEGEKESFESAIKNNLITIEDVLKKRQEENFYYDGGSRFYKYYNFYIMKCRNKDDSVSMILGPNEYVNKLCDW